MPGPWLAKTASIEVDDALRGLAQIGELGGRLHRAEIFQSPQRLQKHRVRRSRPQGVIGVDRHEPGFDADPRCRCTDLPQMGDRRRHRIERTPIAELRLPGPMRCQFVLETFHRIAEIGSFFRPAARIYQDRQITALANRIHPLEEEIAVAAQKILNVVL